MRHGLHTNLGSFRTFKLLLSIFPRSPFPSPALLSAVSPARDLLPRFFFLSLPPLTPGVMVEPSTSARHHRPTAPSEWCTPATESASASVQVAGFLGKPCGVDGDFQNGDNYREKEKKPQIMVAAARGGSNWNPDQGHQRKQKEKKPEEEKNENREEDARQRLVCKKVVTGGQSGAYQIRDTDW